MFTIQLNKLKYFAHHGWHNEESITGSWFEVNIAIDFKEDGLITQLKQTIDYVAIEEMVKQYFTVPVKLLETLAQQICDGIYATDNRITQINITIEKLNPPIPNFTGSVGVTLSKMF